MAVSHLSVNFTTNNLRNEWESPLLFSTSSNISTPEHPKEHPNLYVAPSSPELALILAPLLPFLLPASQNAQGLMFVDKKPYF